MCLAIFAEPLDRTFSGPLPAVFTDAIDLKSVAGGFIVELLADLQLDLVHLRREELRRTAASGAYHMMMAAAVMLVFVTGDAVVKGHFTG